MSICKNCGYLLSAKRPWQHADGETICVGVIYTRNGALNRGIATSAGAS